MKSLSTTAFVALLIGGLQAASPASSGPAYIVVPLGSASIPTLTATGVNDKGQVCGWGQRPDYPAFGFVSGSCGGGVKLVDSGHGIALAMNGSGQVTGVTSRNGQGLAFLTGPNGYGTSLVSTPSTASTEGHGVNKSGQVCGDYFKNSIYYAFLTTSNGGTLTLLGATGPAAFSFANAVNDYGQVVGGGPMGGYGAVHAFVTDPNSVTLKDLGVVFGDSSIATAVNNHGQVAGYSYYSTTRSSHAFVSDPNGGPLHDIGALGVVITMGHDGTEEEYFNASANGINDAGVVVGGTGTPFSPVGFIYKNGQMVDLNTLIDPSTGIHIFTASGISNDGFICGAAGYGTDQSAPSFAVLLIPRATHLAAPTALTATGHNTTVALHWTASPGAQSYAIYRSTTAGVIGDHPIDADIHFTSYTDTGRKNGVKYYYAIRAEDQTGLSNQSAPASATPHS